VTTVYRMKLNLDGVGVDVWANSRILSWEGWPEDVVEIVRYWNRDKRLRFNYTSLTFKCPDCSRFVNAKGSTAARLDGAYVCDDCVIRRARKYGRRGRAETELEKAKRWQRNMSLKLKRYRHNAIQEHAFVLTLKARIAELEETLAEMREPYGPDA
jgi:predicted RNA-binding Zn-ribbon protein involved in translation (DUF1610 family)